MKPDVSIVVPTLGRSSLDALLSALPDDPDWEVILVDDRPDQTSPLSLPATLPAPHRSVVRNAAGHHHRSFS